MLLFIVLAYLHYQVRILIQIWTANQIATLYYLDLFTLHGVWSDSNPNGQIQELESAFANVNKPYDVQKSFVSGPLVSDFYLF